MIEGNGPKWLFDIDSLTQSMNYVPVAASTIINESAGTQGELNAGTSEEISQDCTVMPIWKDASYFDSHSKDVEISETNLLLMIKISSILEATHVEFFSDEDKPKVDLGNITNSYTVPTTPNTRIYKDHSIENVIGDVKTCV
ncbi:hypothetical protein Tco_0095849 [Tanacetum coccineum]